MKWFKLDTSVIESLARSIPCTTSVRRSSGTFIRRRDRRRYRMKVAIITASTAVYREKEENQSGEVIRQMVEEADMEVVFMKALPNDRTVLSTVFQRMADNHLADLILTTGGAGCAPEDCTPEATMDVVDRPIVGIPEGMRAHMLAMTKRTMLNRSAAGIRGDVLIVNLPGKAGAVKECLSYILPEVIHAVSVIKGEV